MAKKNKIPTLYEYGGGQEQYEKLIKVFYDKVLDDSVLRPIFEHMDEEHIQNVSYFLIEVFQGPTLYSNKFGKEGLKRMVGKHIGKRVTEEQRKRWMSLLLETAEEIELPMDPEFSSAFVGHIEWGTRIAKINSHLTENLVTDDEVIPKWGWGEVKGPYDIVGSLFNKKNAADTNSEENEKK